MKDCEIAVIGAGNWGKNIIRTLSSMGALHSVTDKSPMLRQSVESQYQDVTVFDDIYSLLQNSNCPIVLATPVATHFALAKKLLEAGRDLLIEKPMAMNQQECSELNALAKQNKCILMVGHLLLYQPAISFIKEYLTEKRLGNIHQIYQVRRNLGTIEPMKMHCILWVCMILRCLTTGVRHLIKLKQSVSPFLTQVLKMTFKCI